MKEIETKTVIMEGINFEEFKYQTKENEEAYFKMMDKVQAELIQHAKGFWGIYKTDREDVWEFKLEPLSEEIKNAGYDWKEYREFIRGKYKGRLWGSTPVGFRYKG